MLLSSTINKYYIHICLFFLILLSKSSSLSETAAVTSEKCKHGKWHQLSTAEVEGFKHVQSARNSLVVDNNGDLNAINSANEKWLKDSCPAQLVQHSCYAHGNVERAFAAEHRVWTADEGESGSSSCKELSGSDFLKFLTGKNLHLVGDSVMMQVWVSLVCELHMVEKSTIDIHFFHHSEKTGAGAKFNNRSCPWKEEHCHIHGGVLNFPGLSGSIEYHSVNRADTFPFVNRKSNIYLINNGLHFHDQNRYRDMINGLNVNLAKYLNALDNKAAFYFSETFPQHFSAPNGDYDMRQPNTASDGRSGISCFPKLDFEQNWRNKIAHSLLDKRVLIIPIEDQLNSQWDGHIANSRLVPYSEPDCTHWCYPAAAFKYVNRVLFNYIVT